MILGDICSRDCKFCNVKKGKPELKNFSQEIEGILKIVDECKYDYVTITSVTRDDLSDYGIKSFIELTEALHKKKVKVELLIPDLKGNEELLKKICAVEPEVINHNIEMIERLYSLIRPLSDFNRSLSIINNIKKFNKKTKIISKTGFMIGLGETEEEVIKLIDILSDLNIDILTIGQYLQPSKNHWDVVKYWEPENFVDFKNYALKRGFKAVISEPYCRSSYRAKETYLSVKI